MTKQPNSSHCFACGIESEYGLKLSFYSEGDQSVICDYVVPERFQGFPGTVHGGIVASILDEILVRSFMAGDPSRLMYTAKLTVRYRKPVPIGEELHGVGTVVKDRGRRGEAKAELFGPDGQLLAEAEALAVEFPKEEMEEDFEGLGWKVYPDEE